MYVWMCVDVSIKTKRKIGCQSVMIILFFKTEDTTSICILTLKSVITQTFT